MKWLAWNYNASKWQSCGVLTPESFCLSGLDWIASMLNSEHVTNLDKKDEAHWRFKQKVFLVNCCIINILRSISSLRLLFWSWLCFYSKHANTWLESLVWFLVVGSWTLLVSSWHWFLKFLYSNRNLGTTLYFCGE